MYNMKMPRWKISTKLPNLAETFITEDERRRGGRNRCKSGHIWPTNWNINLGILIYSVVKQIYVVLSARGAGAIFPIRSPFVPICRNECNKAQICGSSSGGLLLHIITMAPPVGKSCFFFDAATPFCFWLLVLTSYPPIAIGGGEMVRLKWDGHFELSPLRVLPMICSH